jgi:hypothetical protein
VLSPVTAYKRGGCRVRIEQAGVGQHGPGSGQAGWQAAVGQHGLFAAERTRDVA